MSTVTRRPYNTPADSSTMGFVPMLDRFFDTRQVKMMTSIPGYIVSFDPATQTATVQPGVRRINRTEEPTEVIITTKDLPEIDDVPVQFAGDVNGGFVHTFPIKPGDEVLLVFTNRTIDLWLQEGGIQDPYDIHQMHTINGCVAIPGIRSNPQKIPSYNPSDAEFRNWQGDQVVQLKANKDINIFTPANINIDAGTDVNITAGREVNIDSGANTNQTSANHNISTATLNISTTDRSIIGGSGTGIMELVDVRISSHLEVAGVTVEGHVHTSAGAGNTSGPMR